jgi:transcriptional regulator with XRE-family HTH domain
MTTSVETVAKKLGKKIRNARKELGYKRIEDFAKEVNIPVSELRKAENGEVLPPLKVVGFVCRQFNIPPRAFIHVSLEKENLLFRGKKKNHKLAESDKNKLAVLKDLIETLIEFGEAHYNRFDFEGNPNPEIAARKFIEVYHLRKKNFNTWKTVLPLLAKKNIYVFAIPLKSHSALIHNAEPFFIVFNSNEPIDRWSFSLLHEIGHFIAPEEEQDNEAYADNFAGNVLIPEEMRYELWRKLNVYIKKRWYGKFFSAVRQFNRLVSPEAVFYTLIKTFDGDLGKFSQFRKYCEKKRVEESFSGKGKVLYPKVITEKLRKLFEEGKITEGRYKELTLR